MKEIIKPTLEKIESIIKLCDNGSYKLISHDGRLQIVDKFLNISISFNLDDIDCISEKKVTVDINTSKFNMCIYKNTSLINLTIY